MMNVKSYNPDLQINAPQLITFLQIILLLIIVSNTFNFIQKKSPTSVSGEMKAYWYSIQMKEWLSFLDLSVNNFRIEYGTYPVLNLPAMERQFIPEVRHMDPYTSRIH